MVQPLQFRKEPDPELFPEELLRRYRIRAGLPQEELANLIGLTSSRMIQSWEGGFALPKPARLSTLIEIFYKQAAFGSDQALEEARSLWTTIKNFYESNSEKLLTYPHFDVSWFEKEVLKAAKPSPSVAVHAPSSAPASLPLPVTPVKPLPSLPMSAHSIFGRET
jgi:transcriptional regulator with XRE-family HTH domain